MQYALFTLHPIAVRIVYVFLFTFYPIEARFVYIIYTLFTLYPITVRIVNVVYALPHCCTHCLHCLRFTPFQYALLTCYLLAVRILYVVHITPIRNTHCSGGFHQISQNTNLTFPHTPSPVFVVEPRSKEMNLQL